MLMFRVIDTDSSEAASYASYLDARRAFLDVSFSKFNAINSGVGGSVKLVEGDDKVLEEQDYAAWISSKRKGSKRTSSAKKPQSTKATTIAKKARDAGTERSKPARVSLGGEEKATVQQLVKNPVWADMGKKEMQGELLLMLALAWGQNRE